LPLPLQNPKDFVNAARQRLDVGSSVNSGFDVFKRPVA
jgi:Tfp pilus assembly protein FimV